MTRHSAQRIAEYTRNGWWGKRTINGLFRRLVAERPDQMAIVDPPNRESFTDGQPARYTFAQLERRVCNLAATLLECEVGKGDVIAVQLPNIAELAMVYLAAARIGAVVTPFPVQFREHELEYMTDVTEPRVFVTCVHSNDRRHAEMIVDLQGSIPSLLAVLAFGDDVPGGTMPLDSMMVSPDDADKVAAYRKSIKLRANDVFTVCWTSGTESDPKPVPRSHNDWIAISWATVDGAELDAESKLLNPFPMVNMAGIGGMLVPWLLCGGTLVMHQMFDLPTYLAQIAAESITYTVAPPALLNLLLIREELLASTDISTLRVIGSGSSPLSPWMVRSWQEKHGIPVTNLFASNEGLALMSASSTVPDPDKRAQLFPRFGVAECGWEARFARGMVTRLADLQTGEIITEPGRAGELRVKGPTIFAGYYLDDDLNAAAFDSEGFFRTGDVFEIAEQDTRFYRYVDRAKDIIIRGGMNISAAELESLIIEHKQIAACAVVGYPDEVMGERVCAFVVPTDGATITLEQLVKALQDEEIASYKLPERLEVIESMPRNATGKVRKPELRARLAAEAN